MKVIRVSDKMKTETITIHMNGLKIQFLCDEPNRRENLVGRTPEEQEKFDELAMRSGSLWGKLNMGEYRYKWEWEFKRLLKAGLDTGDYKKSLG